jgi:aspartate-semialdehyde dehydrogenase
LLNAKDPDVELFPHRLAFNLIPQVGEFLGDSTVFERAPVVELVRLWATDSLPAIGVTAVLVPTYHGVLMTVTALFDQVLPNVEAIKAALKTNTQIKILDAPEEKIYPMPMLTAHDASIHIGRIRAAGMRLQMVISFDPALLMAKACVEASAILTAS